MLQVALDNDALAPVWQIQTAQAHAQTAHSQQVQAQAAQAQTDSAAPVADANAIDGKSPTTQPAVAAAAAETDTHNTPSVFGIEGKAPREQRPQEPNL